MLNACYRFSKRFMMSSRLARSIGYALKGLAHVFKTELSFRLQILAGAVVVVLMLLFPLPLWQRIILLLLIASVLVLEVINTIFERIVDTFKPRIHPVVGEIKDMMAAAVLIASITSGVVGFLLLWPYLI